MADDEVVFTRDKRVDELGFIKELQDLYADPLKKAVKAKHEAGTRLEGDYFTCRIDPSSKTTVDPAKWFKLFNDTVISRKDFLEGLNVSVTDARRILGEKDFEKISETVPAENKLSAATRKKGVEVGLLAAINALSHTINADKRAAA